jgi:hypothetical protein
VTLAARGACLNNGPMLPREQSKRDVIRAYKFCATMENSVGVDYVSEKMWDGLAAGCLPIYYGAPNIQEHLPSPNAVIDYVALGATPEALAAEVKRLTGDKAAYEAAMAWRSAPLEALGLAVPLLLALAAALAPVGPALPLGVPVALPLRVPVAQALLLPLPLLEPLLVRLPVALLLARELLLLLAQALPVRLPLLLEQELGLALGLLLT